MEDFKIITGVFGDPVFGTFIVNESRKFKMQLVSEVLTDEQQAADHLAHFAVIIPELNYDRVMFEIDLNGDPEYDLWDMKLFRDAITFYCKDAYKSKRFLISISNQPQLYPYEPDGEFESVDTEADPNQQSLPF